MTEYGRLIRQQRESVGWTQAELAARLGASRTSVSRWERGHRTPRLHHTAALTQVLGLPSARFACTAVRTDPGARIDHDALARRIAAGFDDLLRGRPAADPVADGRARGGDTPGHGGAGDPGAPRPRRYGTSAASI